MKEKRSSNNPLSRLLALTVAFAFALSFLTPVARADAREATPEPPIEGIIAQSAADFTTWRLAGATRYQTMSLIVSEAYQMANDAVLCSGESYQDGLAASALAGMYKCPVITTETDALTPDAEGQLVRLNTRHVMIVGNAESVSKRVETSLRSKGFVVERVSGKDYVDTSVELMKRVRTAGSNSNAVVVAASANYADALSISPWSYASATPIVYAGTDGILGDAAALAIKADESVKRVIIVGGHSAVTDSVINKLGADYEYTRLAGEDRYATSANIARWSTTQGLTWNKAAVATGLNYADALPGGAAMGYKRAPLLLVHSTTDPAVNLIKENNATVSPCYVFGGSNAVPDALAAPALYGVEKAKPQTTTTPDANATNNTNANTNANTGTNTNTTTTAQTKFPAKVINNDGTYLDEEDHLRTDNPDVVMDYAYTSQRRSDGDDVFHYAWCSHVNRISSGNLVPERTSARELIERTGRRPCEHCEPPSIS